MAARQTPNKEMECNELQQDIMKLQDVLKMEKANYAKTTVALQEELKLYQEKLMAESQIIVDLKQRLKLSQEKLAAEPQVEETKALREKLKLCQEEFEAQLQVERQKNMSLKEELKTNTVRYAAASQLEKQTLQEELKLSQEKLMAELQVERDTIVSLKEQLKISQERSAAELKEEKRSTAYLRDKMKFLLQKLTDDQDTFYQKTMEFKLYRQTAARQELALRTEVQMLKAQLTAQSSPNQGMGTVGASAFKKLRHFLHFTPQQNQTEQKNPEEGPTETPQPDQTKQNNPKEGPSETPQPDQTEQENPQGGPSETPQPDQTEDQTEKEKPEEGPSEFPQLDQTEDQAEQENPEEVGRNTQSGPDRAGTRPRTRLSRKILRRVRAKHPNWTRPSGKIPRRVRAKHPNRTRPRTRPSRKIQRRV
ncbi:uncharacterized protein AKAME5_002030900 [Lates japonicus]|uniref:Uncharacterized protein n=1 Tax=Lates japonicus TaxID=270547 RepID=A0AAD3N9Z2_LATJO|nr:uncharacterized protein AKAME5_002030900 [Lates japonicus]